MITERDFMKGTNVPIMKKIFYTYMIFMMLGIACVTVHASGFICDIKSERTDGSINISGNTGLSREENILLLITDKNEKYEDLRTDNFEQKVYSAAWCSTATDGSFNIVMKLRTEHGTGTYKCLMFMTGGEKKEQLFEYYNPLDIVNALKELSNYTIDQKQQFAEKIAEVKDVLGIDTTEFEKESFPKEKLAEIMIKMRTSAYESAEHFNNDFRQVLSMIQLDMLTDDQEINTYIENHYEDLKIDKRYISADETVKTKVCTQILNTDFDLPSDMQQFILNQLTLEEFLNAEYWNEYQELYSQYSDVILLSAAYREKLERTDAVKVFKRMFEKKTVFTTATEITVSLQEAIDYSNSGETTGNRPGVTGGGSSGGGGGLTVSNPSILPQKPTDNQGSEISFSDLAGYEWAETAITYLKNKNIVSGYEDNTFRPYGKVKREEFVKMLVCLIGATKTADISHMKDVIEGEWYYDYISKGVAAGIISGVSEDRFGVGMELTRQEMAAMVCRACGLTKTAADVKKFNDADEISDYAVQSVEILYGNGIISGDDNFNFNPRSHATRAEAARILYMLIQQI